MEENDPSLRRWREAEVPPTRGDVILTQNSQESSSSDNKNKGGDNDKDDYDNIKTLMSNPTVAASAAT